MRNRWKANPLWTFHGDANKFKHPLAREDEREDAAIARATERVERTNTLLNSLGEKQALVLKYTFGLDGCERLTQKQIAAKLGITTSMVGYHKKKALKALQSVA